MQPISGGKPHALALSSTQRIQTWGEEIVLVYSSADSTLCPSLTPTVYFRMHCSNSVNLPVYQGENNINCTYTFTVSWGLALQCDISFQVDHEKNTNIFVLYVRPKKTYPLRERANTKHKNWRVFETYSCMLDSTIRFDFRSVWFMQLCCWIIHDKQWYLFTMTCHGCHVWLAHLFVVESPSGLQVSWRL